MKERERERVWERESEKRESHNHTYRERAKRVGILWYSHIQYQENSRRWLRNNNSNNNNNIVVLKTEKNAHSYVAIIRSIDQYINHTNYIMLKKCNTK